MEHRLKSTHVYFGFALFRILNALLIQSQFDPDEYWQNLEPAYCRVFFGEPGDACSGLTWEWKRRPSSMTADSLAGLVTMGLEGPLRSYVSILPTLFLYYILKFLAWDTTFLVAKGPILLNAVLVAAPTDWTVWWISSRWMESSSDKEKGGLANWCTFCSLSSWFWAYGLVRTYSNSLETVLVASSLALVAKELVGGERGDKTRLWRARLAFLVGGVCCSIRFTSLTAFVPMGIVLGLQEGSILSLTFASYIFVSCAVPGLCGLFATLILDRLYYGFWAIPFLGLIQFNVILGNGSLYGTHPIHWYLTAGIPAITGSILPFLVLCLLSKRTKGERNLWIICFCYVIAHSVSEHKEFRFMLPVLPIFCLLSGRRMRDTLWRRSRRKAILIAVALVNLIVFLYLGLVHQRGAWDVNMRIVELVKREQQTYTIHYLLGCHSTPLHSHLHVPPIKFETWTLDCSPDCRSNPEVECESYAFAKNPEEFTESKYFHCSDFEEGTCVTDLRLFYPDFLVTGSEYLPKIRSRLATMGMEEVARFVHGIDGIRLAGGLTFGSAACIAGQSAEVSLLLGSAALCIDELVLYKNNVVKPRF